MFLRTLTIEGYKCFGKKFQVQLSNGLNVLVGENGAGKTAIIDAIRLLLLEDEYGRGGVKDSDFHLPFTKGATRSSGITITALFDDLIKEESVAFLPWVVDSSQATLNLEVENKETTRGFRPVRWGGVSRASMFDPRNQHKPAVVESNIEWRLFLARCLDGCTRHHSIGNLNQTWKIWALCARGVLGNILAGTWRGRTSFPNHDVGVRAPQGEGRVTVYNSLELGNPSAQSNLRITTFHQIKGETLDAALVVSSPTRQGDGGHWLHWVEPGTGDDEHARFAYVASSRPRRLLAWGIPEPDAEEREILKRLGFVPAR